MAEVCPSCGAHVVMCVCPAKEGRRRLRSRLTDVPTPSPTDDGRLTMTPEEFSEAVDRASENVRKMPSYKASGGDPKAVVEGLEEGPPGYCDIDPDLVNHPPHYTSHPSGVECIEVTEHMNFCVGNAIKYLWRAGRKGEAVEDLEKAKWYLDREIERVKSLRKRNMNSSGIKMTDKELAEIVRRKDGQGNG